MGEVDTNTKYYVEFKITMNNIEKTNLYYYAIMPDIKRIKEKDINIEIERDKNVIIIKVFTNNRAKYLGIIGTTLRLLKITKQIDELNMTK